MKAQDWEGGRASTVRPAYGDTNSHMWCPLQTHAKTIQHQKQCIHAHLLACAKGNCALAKVKEHNDYATELQMNIDAD